MSNHDHNYDDDDLVRFTEGLRIPVCDPREHATISYVVPEDPTERAHVGLRVTSPEFGEAYLKFHPSDAISLASSMIGMTINPQLLDEFVASTMEFIRRSNILNREGLTPEQQDAYEKTIVQIEKKQAEWRRSQRAQFN